VIQVKISKLKLDKLFVTSIFQVWSACLKVSFEHF